MYRKKVMNVKVHWISLTESSVTTSIQRDPQYTTSLIHIETLKKKLHKVRSFFRTNDVNVDILNSRGKFIFKVARSLLPCRQVALLPHPVEAVVLPLPMHQKVSSKAKVLKIACGRKGSRWQMLQKIFNRTRIVWLKVSNITYIWTCVL